MLRIVRLSVFLLLCTASFTNVFATIDCTPGAAVRSPVSGDLVDCLEGGGDGCMVCSEAIVVQP